MGKTIYATAPTRVDFAGGTLDIYPLFLFFDGGKTLNAAIDLDAKVWITPRDDGRITIYAQDIDARLEHDGGIDTLPMDGPTALIARVLRHYKPQGGLDVRTNLMPPHGSGLGASSALFVCLSHAILAYMGEDRGDTERIIRVSNALEAQLMGMPAGMQDYYPPTYGGLCAVHYDLESIWIENLDPDGIFLAELQQYLIVSSTNITHHSGTTNWGKMRNFFDKVPRTVESLGRIKETAEASYLAFQQRDVQAVARHLNAEWENRKGLSDGVTTREINTMINASAKAGAWANKLCGAGGGGCMITLAPPDKHAAVIAALEAHGCTHMATKLVPDGVQVTVTE